MWSQAQPVVTIFDLFCYQASDSTYIWFVLRKSTSIRVMTTGVGTYRAEYPSFPFKISNFLLYFQAFATVADVLGITLVAGDIRMVVPGGVGVYEM